VILNGQPRHWLLTWRTYGTWLPGDGRGFVGTAVTREGVREAHTAPGALYAEPAPPLREYATDIMRGPPVFLDVPHAGEVFGQLRETARIRGWEILALAVLSNHIHLVARTPEDIDGAHLLRDFKAYASRRLNAVYGKPDNGSWWSESGSRRVLRDDPNIRDAIAYVANQHGAHLIWSASLPNDRAPGAEGERPA
jgi:REP element-mobilizing transposase RayT